jgi:hypothetical protein
MSDPSDPQTDAVTTSALTSLPLLMHGASDVVRKYVITTLLTPVLKNVDAHSPEVARLLPVVLGQGQFQDQADEWIPRLFALL